MTPEAQQIAIAKACGWTQCDCRECKTDGYPLWIGPGFDDKESKQWRLAFSSLPDYLNDLNAIREVEEILTPEQTWTYCEILSEQINNGTHMRWGIRHATAAQCAEAILRTLGKWRDTP